MSWGVRLLARATVGQQARPRTLHRFPPAARIRLIRVASAAAMAISAETRIANMRIRQVIAVISRDGPARGPWDHGVMPDGAMRAFFAATEADAP